MGATQAKLERETMFKWKKAYEEEAQDHAATAINLQKLITELEKDLDYCTDFVNHALISDIDNCEVLKKTKEIRDKHNLDA